MEQVPEPSAQRVNLTELQVASLQTVGAFVALVGYTWLVAVLWPLTGAHARAEAWLGSTVLVVGTAVAYTLRERNPQLASQLVVGASLLGIFSALLAFRLPGLAYLFVLPLSFSSVLLGQRGVLATALAATLLSRVAGVQGLGLAPLSLDVILPVLVIALVTVASSLSAHNLYVALGWAWNGYESARVSARLAHEREAELRRTLKALDEATYRLERANYMLTVARDEAEEARRLKQQFAQTISHELRTPLNLIVGFTELMTGSPEYYGGRLAPTYMRDLAIVHRNACHLQTLVNDVLDLARIEAAQMAIVPEETDPGALVQEAVNTARSLVESRGLELRARIEPSLPRLWLDPTRIRQVLINLLNNAARFTDQGSITVRVRRQGDEVEFSVTDTGIGIAPENLPRIFQEFQQLDGTTRRRHEGAGLGLAISRRFVELHGGRIWVESRVGQGSTFFFGLPVSRPTSPAGAGSQARERAVSAPGIVGEDRILLAVTPSAPAAALLTRYVRGCRTVIARDLQQGQQLARQLMPQAVLVDAACAPLDPVALQALGQAWALPATPMLVCPLPQEERLQERLAVEGYLVKPVSRRGLWDVLRQFGDKVDTVLVIDDDHDFVRLMERLLDSPVRRYQVVSAYTGREGLAMLRLHQPDLVLLDLGLPDMEGLRFIEHMRSDPLWQHVPIVIVSAQGELDSGRALDGGLLVSKANGLLPGEVMQWVQSVLDSSARRWLPMAH